VWSPPDGLSFFPHLIPSFLHSFRLFLSPLMGPSFGSQQSPSLFVYRNLFLLHHDHGHDPILHLCIRFARSGLGHMTSFQGIASSNPPSRSCIIPFLILFSLSCRWQRPRHPFSVAYFYRYRIYTGLIVAVVRMLGVVRRGSSNYSCMLYQVKYCTRKMDDILSTRRAS
jgi:hypothetical protein